MITPYGSDRGKGVWGKTQLSMEGGGTLLTDHAVKEWLSRYADAAREVALLRARTDAIRDRASSPASPILDGMPRAPGFDGDKLGGIIGTVDAIDRESDEKAQDAAALYAEIDGAIRQVNGKHSAERRSVLQCRYLDLMAWKDVLFLFFGDMEDLAEREDAYMKRLYKIHKAALEDLQEILVTNNLQQEIG